MEYPVSRILSYDLNIGKHVFQRQYINNNTNLINGAKFIAYYFTVFMETPLIERQIAHFENEISKYNFDILIKILIIRLIIKHNANSSMLVELINHGSFTVTNEMKRGINEWMRLLLTGNFFSSCKLNYW